MSRQGSIRRVFPGGNTSEGFFSYYDNVIGSDARRVFLLKGGPGAGKSTFMKRIADEMLQRGLAAEFHHCSSDPDSIDAVVFPSVGIALFDGTAPHVIDPKFPGLVDEIVDLGPYCDETALRPHKDDIMRLTAEGKASFQRAYKYLAAAKAVRANWTAVHEKAMSPGFANERALQLVTDVLNIAQVSGRTAAPSSSGPESGSKLKAGPASGHGPGRMPTPVGRRRRLFASAITPNGPRHHLDTLVNGLPHVFVVRGQPGAGKSPIVNRVVDAVTERGLDAELFYCAFEPHKLEHVIMADIGVAIITSAPPHEFSPPGATVIDLDEGLSLSEADVRHAATARQLFWDLFDHATASLLDAQRFHLEVEALYAPAMDFDGMEGLRRRIRGRIFAYLSAG